MSDSARVAQGEVLSASDPSDLVNLTHGQIFVVSGLGESADGPQVSARDVGDRGAVDAGQPSDDGATGAAQNALGGLLASSAGRAMMCGPMNLECVRHACLRSAP